MIIFSFFLKIPPPPHGLCFLDLGDANRLNIRVRLAATDLNFQTIFTTKMLQTLKVLGRAFSRWPTTNFYFFTKVRYNFSKRRGGGAVCIDLRFWSLNFFAPNFPFGSLNFFQTLQSPELWNFGRQLARSCWPTKLETGGGGKFDGAKFWCFGGDLFLMKILMLKILWLFFSLETQIWNLKIFPLRKGTPILQGARYTDAMMYVYFLHFFGCVYII